MSKSSSIFQKLEKIKSTDYTLLEYTKSSSPQKYVRRNNNNFNQNQSEQSISMEFDKSIIKEISRLNTQEDLFKALECQDIDEAYKLLEDPSICLDHNYLMKSICLPKYYIGIDFIKRLLLGDHMSLDSIKFALELSITLKYPSELAILLADHMQDGSSIGLIYSINYNLELSKYFLNDPNCNPSFYNNWALENAVCELPLEMFKLLLKDPRLHLDSSHRVLAIAAGYGNYEATKLILEDGRMDPTVYKRGGYKTALDTALEQNHPKIVELLMSDPRVNPLLNAKSKL